MEPCEKSVSGGKAREGKRRVSKPLLVLAVFLALSFVFVTCIKVHATWLLADAPTRWNPKQVAKLDRDREEFKFAVFADTHNSTKAFGRLREEVEEGDYLFAIDAGDVAIDSGEVKFRLFINQVSSMKTPVLTAVGNHDIAAGGYANYERIFGPRYYSFTVGRCLFIMLDNAGEVRVDDEQMEWFRQELGRKAAFPNIFVFMHVPPFRGRRNQNLPMKDFLKDRESAQEIQRLCIENDVKIVFCGHCHTFDYDIWPGETHYVMTGGGGGRLWDVDRARSMYHFMSITVNGREGDLEMEPIDQRGLHFAYQYIEEPWVYTYTYCAVRYFRFAPALLAAALLFAFMAVRPRRKKKRE